MMVRHDPWLILTDLDSTDADVSWYGFRSWIECSYRDVKSDGMRWHKTRLRRPARAERLVEEGLNKPTSKKRANNVKSILSTSYFLLPRSGTRLNHCGRSPVTIGN